MAAAAVFKEQASHINGGAAGPGGRKTGRNIGSGKRTGGSRGGSMKCSMARMTDEEADYWDEYYIKNPPTPGPNGTGFFTQRRKTARSVTIDDLSADWPVVSEAATETGETATFPLDK
jgi:hypothetical protein